MASSIKNTLTQILVPKKKTNPKGASYTSTFQPNNTNAVLSAPDFRAHLKDIFTDRTSQDSKALIKDLLKYDSDMSATLHAYLTIADTCPRFYVYDINGELDRVGQQQLDIMISALTRRTDYTTGFTFTKSLRELSEDLRYMVLARGGVAGELVFNKLLVPAEIRNVDIGDLQWFESSPGVYKPQQLPAGASQAIPLDIPTFFVKYFRQNPTDIYAESPFVSAINTIAARQQVINDLYRIMQKTGYPRMEATVVEEVLRKNAPLDMQQSEDKMRAWLNARLSEVANDLTNLNASAAYVHFDAVTPTIMNQKGPGTSMNVTEIINVLNSQNQSALKTMATVIGRGEGGVNTASVESLVFSKSASSINGPVADMFSDMFSLAMQMTGYQGYVECCFDPVELRPELELEPQKVVKQTRLLEALSLGMITDDEFHIEMYNRPRPDSAPILSGTNFIAANAALGGDASSSATGVDVSSISPNSDPTGRAITPSGSKAAKSNSMKKVSKGNGYQ